MDKVSYINCQPGSQRLNTPCVYFLRSKYAQLRRNIEYLLALTMLQNHMDMAEASSP